MSKLNDSYSFCDNPINISILIVHRSAVSPNLLELPFQIIILFRTSLKKSHTIRRTTRMS